MAACDCSAFLAKYVLYLFNIVFFLLGGVVLAIGIWVAADIRSFIAVIKLIDYKELQTHFQQFTQPAVLEQSSYILIAVGALMFIVSFLGCCGALRESPSFLTCYAIFLLTMLLMEASAVVLAAVYRKEAEKETRAFLKSTIKEYYATHEKTDAVTLMWNYLMAQMHCCGVDNYEDFSEAEKWQKEKKNKTVPDACCVLAGEIGNFKVKDSNCPYSPTDSNSYWKKGCYDKIVNWILENSDMVIGISIGLGLLQLLGIFLTFCLRGSIY